jgi:hypothetical protein
MAQVIKFYMRAAGEPFQFWISKREMVHPDMASKQDLLPLNTGGRRIFIQSRRPESNPGALERWKIISTAWINTLMSKALVKAYEKARPKKFIKSSLNFPSFGVGWKVDPNSYVVEIALWMKNNAGHSTKRSKALSLSAFIVQILIVYSRNIFVLKSIDRARQSGFLLFLPFSSRKKACVSLTLLFGSSRAHALAKYI